MTVRREVARDKGEERLVSVVYLVCLVCFG
jgi:hypothetical protein